MNDPARRRRCIGIIVVCVVVFAGVSVAPLVVSTMSSATGGITQPRGFSWSSYRLPTWVTPSKYDVQLLVDMTTFAYSGVVTIDLDVNTATETLVLHSVGLSFDSVTLTQGAATVPILRTSAMSEYEFAVFSLASQLSVGTATLVIAFSGIVAEDLHGFYRSSYTVNGTTYWMATTQFEATDARRAFPCFDEPAMKANFTISIQAPSAMTVLSNMPESSAVAGSVAGTTMRHFATSPKMSTYLVAFVISNFQAISTTTARGLPVRVFARPEVVVEQGAFALEAAANITTFFEQFTNINFALPKLDLIAIPDFSAGAMENWGLITYRETALLVTPDSGPRDVQRVAVVVAHELAHQWFGDLVTMAWWSDLWLNEGFASYMEYVGTAQFRPSYQMWEQFISADFLPALHTDSLASSRAIHANVESPGAIDEMFDTITYSKGGSVLRMIASFLGDTTWRDGLRHYLSVNAYANAVPDTLWAAQQAVSGLDVPTYMRNWIYEPGYPVVRATLSGTDLTVSQERFYLFGNGTSSSAATTWWVPLTYKTQAAPASSTSVPFSTASSTVSVGATGGWIKLNVGATGFYRVLYDTSMWTMLKSGVTAKTIDSAGRAELVSDAFNLANADLMLPSTALDFVTALQTEDSYIVWQAALGGLSTISLLLDEQPAYNDFRMFVLNVTATLVSTTTWASTASDTHLSALLRSLALGTAVRYGASSAVATAQALYWAFNANETASPIEPTSRDAVYAAVVKYGGYAGYNSIYARAIAATSQVEQRRLLSALAAAPTPDLVAKTLQLCISSYVRSQDSVSCIAAVTGNAVGRRQAWAFFRDNFDLFNARYGSGGFILQTLVSSVIDKFASQAMYEEARDFFASHSLPYAASTISSSLETIQANIQWLARHYAQVEAFLAASAW